jgi:hypothetical protein
MDVDVTNIHRYPSTAFTAEQSCSISHSIAFVATCFYGLDAVLDYMEA